VTTELREFGEERCLMLGDGPLIASASAGRDLVEEALSERASVVAVPVERLDAAFFALRSGLAGELIQKVLNYRLKFAVVGDISSYVQASDALRDFVIECERGSDIIFASDEEELARRLCATAGRDG
jgi:hypothetical protein